MALEPTTGFPLKIAAALQLNLQLEPLEGIKYVYNTVTIYKTVPSLSLSRMLTNVTKVLMPAFWFKQYAELTEDLASMAKTILIVPNASTYTGYGLLGLGLLILSIAGYLTARKAWVSESEDTQILTQNSM